MTRDEVLTIIKQAEEEGWEELDLSGQELTELPEEIGRLKQLKVLILYWNNLSALSEWLTQLTNLQYLDINRNNLGTLPEWLAQLTNLQHLAVGGNNLGTLPEWLTQLTNLQSLDVSWNNLETLPEWLGQLSNLQSLDISRNDLETLPVWLGRLTNLKSLKISRNNLVTLPVWLGKMPQLQNLNIGKNPLKELPMWLGKMTQLRSLDIGYNNFGTLPEWLGRLINLQSLDIKWNNLGTLPEWLGQLTNLKNLDIKWNELEMLPEWLGNLSHLQYLDISNNNLSILPDWLGNLKSLQSLDIGVNNFKTLPEWLAAMPKLTELFIFDNPITEPSPEVLGDALTKSVPADLEAIRRYYAQLREAGEAVFYEAKLLIIGEGGAGKTSLVRKLREPERPLQNHEKSTEGVEVISWYFDLPAGFDQEQYRVNIWDFGGQEIYFATHQFFLTRRSVYILVADTRKQHTDFYEWLRMQEAFGGDSPILLLKNRNRREGNRFYIENLHQLQERFPNLRNVIELDLDEVPQDVYWSALLQELEKHFLKLEHIGQPNPKTWAKVREALSIDNRETMSREAFLQLCYDEGVKREEDALRLSDYLHHLGEILHFQDDPVLADLLILKPTWGLDAVYRVLDNAAIVDNWGEFSRQDLRRLWHEPHYKPYQHELLRLMENFQLCYPLSDKPDTFIAPQLLKESVPEYAWDRVNNLQLRYQYPIFMPRGILSRAIVKLHHRIEEQKLVWRAGVILKSRYARAELLELRGENEIRIRISGRNKRDLLMEIVRALEELHQGFPKLQYNKLIPCNCQTCTSLTNPHFFRLDDLRERLAHSRNTIECNNPPFQQVRIHGLLDDGLLEIGRFQQHDVIQQIIQGDFISGDKIRGNKDDWDINAAGASNSALSFGGDAITGNQAKDIQGDVEIAGGE